MPAIFTEAFLLLIYDIREQCSGIIDIAKNIYLQMHLAARL